MKKIQKYPTFKPVNQNQQMLLPPSLEDFVDQHHPARIVNEVVDKISLQQLYSTYQGGGASSYDPRMLLKVLIYSYICNIYSSRKIESALKENVYFMWLSGMSKPDHNSINRFRSERLKGVLKQLFSEIVILLNEEGLLSIKDIYTDGTKLEANANKFTFVWGKAIKTRKTKILEQIEVLWRYAEEITKEELTDTRPTSYEAINPEKVRQTIEKIDEHLKGYAIDPKVKQKIRRVKKDWPKQLENYGEQEKKLNGRNSYSKTDEDATFMRMKDDHMGNGQLKAAYNWQISTNNQCIVNYSIHQTAGDTNTLIPHLYDYQVLYGTMPEEVTADAGYGSEENYEFSQKHDIEAYIKYNNFHKEETKKYKNDLRHWENLHYNEDKDCFYCPMGQPMQRIKENKETNRNGFEQTVAKYEAINCSGCPLRGACHRASGNRIIEVNHNAWQHRKSIKVKLSSPKGHEKRSRRSIEPETVFGQIKHNKHFNRFMLRGIDKVEIEVGLLAIAHNLSKKSV